MGVEGRVFEKINKALWRKATGMSSGEVPQSLEFSAGKFRFLTPISGLCLSLARDIELLKSSEPPRRFPRLFTSVSDSLKGKKCSITFSPLK